MRNIETAFQHGAAKIRVQVATRHRSKISCRVAATLTKKPDPNPPIVVKMKRRRKENHV